ncbi:ribonuclease H-like domain-containing protein [Anaerosacchariphilus polymeriproducens]|nr:ribonuclease H-like domain-containing protein [Anaerosacchariphilus polymeriproducens]
MITEITKLTPVLDFKYAKNFSYKESIFIDIETTGFSPASSFVYLIGCAYYDGEQWTLIQWFAKSYESEVKVISAFLEFISKYKTLISYNGIGFDLPYIKERCKKLNIPHSLDTVQHIDFYRVILPYKRFFRLNNLKQKTIEEFLSIQRQDKYNGSELISIYLQYLKTQDNNLIKLLLLHNHDDIKGLLSIIPMISYQYIFNGKFNIQNCMFDSLKLVNKLKQNEIIFELQLNIPVPKRISFGNDIFYLTVFQDIVKIKIKIYHGELKYFYKNYKDYYYLPKEDTSIHKSVAFYVDKNFRTQAKAANCYSRKSGHFLPQYEDLFSPYFKIDYFDKNMYFELTEEILSDYTLLKKYILHILSHFQH